ncbi:YrhB domain-containing protein [Streptomyces sp. NBC_00989]|uniref:YrhB domain-containing protein n=1 Tax=Streptomyces sp. NBC_00989 TaxID=2903705 RepID=UPI0038685039|nr:YrhB domain-containing protein [Streptomyces sp. NBC_00989]
MHSPDQRAAAWLSSTYRGLVEPATPRPVHETAVAWIYSCRTLNQQGYPPTPMLSASVVVPKDGSTPFHPSVSAPLADMEPAGERETADRVAQQARRINARGCVVAVHSAMNSAPSVPLPWNPSDEAPGWWARLTRRYFPGFEQVPATDWDSVISAVAALGPDTRGVVWVRRELGGAEATGNLIYAHNHKGQVVLLDGQAGGLAKLDTSLLRELILIRELPDASPVPKYPWEAEAQDFPSALRKARLWLEQAYHGQVELVGPEPGDEIRRGWVFACNTKGHLRDGRWQDGMVDAALVVPKEASAPFGLPNSDPWAWLRRWDAGGTPGSADFPLPPSPGRAAWFEPTLSGLGPVLSATEHADWAAVMDELSGFPVDARAVVWVRRVDTRGRESVGRLLNAVHSDRGVMLIDGASDAAVALEEPGIRSLHVIRYR